MDKFPFEFQNLYAGPGQVIRSSGTLAKGNTVDIGTVLGRISSTGEVVPVDKARSDSATTVYAISNCQADATDQATAITFDLTGEFNIRALKFVDGNTPADHEYSARMAGIFFKNTVSK